MKKSNLMAIASLAVMASTLAGCSKDNRIKVVFWHTMGQNNQAWLNERIKEFNKLYPEVNIEHTPQGGYDDVKEKISKAIPAGTTPTMAYCYPDHVADYLSAGAIEELTPYINSEAYGFGVKEKVTHEDGSTEEIDLQDKTKDDFIQPYWHEGDEYADPDGKHLDGMYSLPFSKSTEVMFYNKTAFDEQGWSVPKTWNELWQWCAQAKEAYPGVTPLGYDSDANMLITMFEQNMIPYTTATPKGEQENFLFNNDEAKSLVTDLKGYYDKGYFITAGTSSNNTYTSNMFVKGAVSGGCLISIGSTGGTGYNWPTTTTEGGETVVSFEVGVAEIPQADIANPKVIMQGPSITFFKRATEEQKRYAWLFYKYLTNTDNSASYSFLTGYTPVRTSSFGSQYYDMYDEASMKGTKYQLIHEVSQFVPSIANHMYTSPAFKGSTAARKEMDGLLAAVCNNGTAVDDAFEDALTNCIFAQG